MPFITLYLKFGFYVLKNNQVPFKWNRDMFKFVRLAIENKIEHNVCFFSSFLRFLCLSIFSICKFTSVEIRKCCSCDKIQSSSTGCRCMNVTLFFEILITNGVKQAENNWLSIAGRSIIVSLVYELAHHSVGSIELEVIQYVESIVVSVFSSCHL